MKWKIGQASMLVLPNLHKPFKMDISGSVYSMRVVFNHEAKSVCYHFEIFPYRSPILPYIWQVTLYFGSLYWEMEALFDGKEVHNNQM